jgi:hypothetical protein
MGCVPKGKSPQQGRRAPLAAQLDFLTVFYKYASGGRGVVENLNHVWGLY